MKIKTYGYCDEPGFYQVSIGNLGNYHVTADSGFDAVRKVKANIKEACKPEAGGPMSGLSLTGRMSHATVIRADKPTADERQARYETAKAVFTQALEAARADLSEKNLRVYERAQHSMMREHARWMEALDSEA